MFQLPPMVEAAIAVIMILFAILISAIQVKKTK